MSFAHLTLQSINCVLEPGHGFIPRNAYTISLDQSDASLTTSLVPSSLSPSPSSHLTKVIDIHEQGSQHSRWKRIFPTEGFFDDTEPFDGVIQCKAEESRSLMGCRIRDQNREQRVGSWITHYFAELAKLVRSLFSVRAAGELLLKSVRS